MASELVEQLRKREHYVIMGPAYLMRMCEAAATLLSAQEEELRTLGQYATQLEDERDDARADALNFKSHAEAQEEEIERLRAQVEELTKLLNWYRRAALNEGSKRDG